MTAQVTEVGFVENSDKLYLCQVQVTADDVRQVVTGLRKHVPLEDLLNKKVVVITNLKVWGPRFLLVIGPATGPCPTRATLCVESESPASKSVHTSIINQRAPDG